VGQQPQQSTAPSAFSPLRQPVFRALWVAAVISNIGMWMQAVGAAWLMTSLTTSPILVSLVQVSSTFPMFLLALPAGALADILDRRRLLLFTQMWMMFAAAVLAVLTVLGTTNEWILLLITFSLGIGAALNAPAWQAIILDVVPRSDLTAAVSLNSAGFNVARAVGPMLGGLVLAVAGAGAVFGINSLSYLGVVLVLFFWRRKSTKSTLPAERVYSAIRTGLRYVRHAPSLQVIFLRTASFVFFAGSVAALLPLIARFELGRGPTAYGVLLGFFGGGSVSGAILLPAFRRRVNTDELIMLATSLFSATLLILGLSRNYAVISGAMFLAGFSWLLLFSTFNASTQAVVPVWVRGRALSVYILIFFGGLSSGSFLWGAVAEATTVSTSIIIAAVGAMLGMLLSMRFKIGRAEELELEPAMDWPTPVLVDAGEYEHEGAVMVTVDYRIDPARRDEFIEAMIQIRRIRRRDGAMRWGLGRDTTDPQRYVEMYVVESWTEHLRQHERLTIADRAIFEKARSFHTGTEPPEVSHFLLVSEKDQQNRQ
jgi:MFS family permease/quinol monooxygenase YgiN